MSTDDDTKPDIHPINHPRNQVRVSVVERDGEIIYAEDDQAAEKFRAELERSRLAAERRRALWGEGGADSMARLCRLFPSLARVAGADPWDADAMLRFACEAHSHGEQLAARFVLSVWNCNLDWNREAHKQEILVLPETHLKRFDIFEALGTWDHEHRSAALAWLNDPFWP